LSETLRCTKCGEIFGNVPEFEKHIIEFYKPEECKTQQYETPLMRDLSKLSVQVMFGLIGALAFFMIFLFPFSITEFCNHGIVTTSNNLFGTFISDLTGVCTYV